MATLTLRDKLYEYIRFADDKKVKAIYTMVEDEINQKVDLWEDEDFLNEMDARLKAYESGKVEAKTWPEVRQKILEKKKRGA